MSRYYSMEIEIRNYFGSKVEQIKEALVDHWGFDDWFQHKDGDGPSLSANGTGNLYGGESEEEFVKRATEAVWEANGTYCAVTITATYMEDLPCEQYRLSMTDYAAYRRESQKTRRAVKKPTKKKVKHRVRR